MTLTIDNLDKPIFIVGLPRSGSTLWLNTVIANPDIYRMGEMFFLTPLRKDFRFFIKNYVGDLYKDENISKMIELIFSESVYRGITGSFWYYDIKDVCSEELKIILTEKIKKSNRSLESIFKILIREITLHKGFNRCCMKFPVYPNHIPKLIKWFPECKIIHISRDPRAMAISRTGDPGGTLKKIKKFPYLESFIKKAMILFVTIQYNWISKLHKKFITNENYQLFLYEDLLADPEKTIKKLSSFIGIDFVPNMLTPQKGKEKGQASSITRKRQEGFDKRAATRWINLISPIDKTIVSLLTKRSMRRFGYNSETHPVFR